MFERRGGAECLKKATTDIFINFFHFHLKTDEIYDSTEDEEYYIEDEEDCVLINPGTEAARAFLLKMEEMHVPSQGGEIKVYYLSSTNITLLDDVIGLGLNP